MSLKSKVLTVVALGLVIMPPVYATIIEGTFSGTVYTVSDPDNVSGLNAFLGLPIIGTFSYDSQALPLVSGGSGTCCSDFIENFPTTPLSISVTVGGITYAMEGTGTSALHTSMGPVSTFFSLQSQNVYGSTALPGGNFTGEILFGLTNYGGTPFLLDGNDAGSASFHFSAPATSQQGVGQITFVDYVAARGASIGFYITDASAGPVVSVPDPGKYLQELLEDVRGVGPGKSLYSKITQAQASYKAGDTGATCAILTGFENEVRAQRGKKITRELSDQFIKDAQTVMATIGCN